MPPALSVRDLCIEARTAAGTVAILHGATLEVAPGEIVGIVGESGSGKTTLVRSVIGLGDGRGEPLPHRRVGHRPARP